MTLIRQNEVGVPFGAAATLVSDKSEQISGIVGEDGRLYIRWDAHKFFLIGSSYFATHCCEVSLPHTIFTSLF